jgi:MSHA biogenesis protein MshQ
MSLVDFSHKTALKLPETSWLIVFLNIFYKILLAFIWSANVYAAVAEFNSGGGKTSTDGLHFYIEDTTKIQVKRLNNTGQVYSPSYLPSSTTPSSSFNYSLYLDNGIFINTNNKTYGPDHDILSGFVPDGSYSNSSSITATSPANPSSSGTQQIATGGFGISSGPQVSIIWKYTTPLDFVTAEVTLTIPTGYTVNASKPVRYYHVFDTYLGGDDKGCGFTLIDSNGKRVMGTYTPPSGTCTSSSSIPGGVSVVESFRERSGNFSKYCAASWYSFYLNGSPSCSILQDADMSNSLSSTYEDTGIGIEYNFTSVGTYTFSYDFVVGSPNVPVYDHLEIQHDGSGTLCAENVTVLACTSAIVPCPAANLVNTGTLTGAVTVSPTTPSVTLAPATFSLGASGTSATVSLLADSPGGTYILSTSGLSAIPLNGIRCWNTATLSQSCSFNISNVPCVSNFECIETGVTYNNLTTTPAARNPLYTELAGNNFKFDVVALQTGGVQATSYTASSNVTVELFDDSASPQPACSAYTSPLASQSITFAAANVGRKTVANNFNLSNAYRKVRCRVKEANISPTVYGCSSDDFSVRPSAVTLTSSATAAAPSASATPVIKAGANFIQSATASGSYSGTLNLDITKLTSQITSQTTTQQSGGVVGTLTPSTLVTNSGNANSTYSEAGYVYLAPGAYRDDTFTAVDNATGDCITSTVSDNNLSDTLVSGKYGCSIGNKVNVSLGRFIPDHFAITQGSSTPACTPSFTYFGQDGFSTLFTLKAQNSSNQTTQNYQGGFAKLGLTAWGNFNFSSASLPAGSVLSASSTAPSGNWSLGLADVLAKHQVSRPTALTSETSIIVKAAPVDSDGVTLTATAVAPGTPLRYGRLNLQNAYGSELLQLPVSLTAQYWNGSAFVLNTDDSCTTVSAPASGSGLTFYPEVTAAAQGNHLSAAETIATVSATNKLVAGDAQLKFTAPGSGNDGYFDLSITAPNWLKFDWNAAIAGDESPSARATFGIYKGNDSQIFLREVY